MDWHTLLSNDKLVAPDETKKSKEQEQREEFERDYSRVLYSNAFRRLHDKTQLFRSELDLFRTIVARLELPEHDEISNSWKRPPLAFLTEASDDASYHILDLEDGCVLLLIQMEERAS